MRDKFKAVSINKRVVDTQLVSTLEELLESAKKGDLTSFAFVDGYADGDTGSGWAHPNLSILARLEIIKVTMALELSDLGM